jgi:HEAT repeat protein
LTTVILLKGVDAALKNSVGRVSNELLWSPVVTSLKAKTKSFVDGVVTRAAQAGAAIGVLVLSMQQADSGTTLTIIAAALAACWLVFGARVRKPYVELFRKALRRGGLERELPVEIDMTGAETLVESLARPDSEDVIAAMNVLAERGRGRLIPALVLYHDKEDVLLRALELFSQSDRKDWFALAERLVNHGSATVELAAVRALAVAGAHDALERHVDHTRPAVRAATALHLAHARGGSLESDTRIADLLTTEGDEGHTLRLSLIDAITAHPSETSSATLLGFAKDPHLTSAVTLALSRVGAPDAIPFLIERLAARDDRSAARRALVRLGEPAMQALVARLHDNTTSHHIRLHIPRTLAAFENATAVRELVLVLTSSDAGFVRYKALRGLEQLALRTALPIPFKPIAAELAKNCIEYLRLFTLSLPLRKDPQMLGRTSSSLVLGLVLDKLHQSFDRITRLVQIAQRTDDIPGVFSALQAQDRHQRARAIEFLDTLVRSFQQDLQQVGVLRLVIDDLSDEARALRAAPLVGAVNSTKDVLIRLAEDSDPMLRELAQQALENPAPRRPSKFPPPEAGAAKSNNA